MADRGKVLSLIEALLDAGQEIERSVRCVPRLRKRRRARLTTLRAEIDAVRATLATPPITPVPDGTPEPDGPVLSWEPNEFEQAAAPETGESDAALNQQLAEDTTKFQAG